MNAPRKPRDPRLDALRGVFLLIMAGVHVPSPLSRLLFQDPWGAFGAAEGFIFLSACLAGFVYGRRCPPAEWAARRRRIFHRVKLIYAVHLGVLLPTVLIVWAVAGRVPPLAAHFSDFLARPWGSLALMPLLLHQPPLFDILPLYVIFLGVTPWLLTFARRHGWTPLLAASLVVWLAVQFKLDAPLFANPTRWPPLRWGAFDILAWQFLWLLGVALGETAGRGPVIPERLRLAVGIPAAAVVLFALALRWGCLPQNWWNADLFLWMDKWTLGPLRLLDVAAWTALLLAWGPRPPRLLLAPVALLGRNSLSVFACHLPLVIAAATLIQQLAPPILIQDSLNFLVIALLFAWAAAWERLTGKFSS